jgi:hypothetical protein
MYWSSDWWWGLPVLVLTVVFHVGVFVLIVKALVLEVRPRKGVRTLAHFIVAIALTALGAAVLPSLEPIAWATLTSGWALFPTCPLPCCIRSARSQATVIPISS